MTTTTTTTAKPIGLATLAHLPDDTPIFMLNMIKYHDVAQYPTTSTGTTTTTTTSTDPQLTGQEAYFTKYIPAFRAIAAKFGGRASLHYLGDALANVVAADGDGDEDDDWDVVILVRYEDKNAFKEIAGSEEYDLQARPHREAAVRRWRLVGTVEKRVGGVN